MVFNGIVACSDDLYLVLQGVRRTLVEEDSLEICGFAPFRFEDHWESDTKELENVCTRNIDFLA
jgi:hypothetical protein